MYASLTKGLLNDFILEIKDSVGLLLVVNCDLK